MKGYSRFPAMYKSHQYSWVNPQHHGHPAEVRPNFLFHARCSGTQCKSCNLEDVKTLKASNAAHSKEQLKTLDTPFVFSNFSNYRLNINLRAIFFSHLNICVKVQSTPTYLHNLSFLL